jgi:DNA polymerase-3 subunit delta
MKEIELSSFKPSMLYISRSSSILDGKIDEIKNYLKDRINLEADFKIFYGSEGLEEGDFLNFFNTPPFFSDKKVTVIKDIDKLPSAQAKKISVVLEESVSEDFNTILIMTSLKEKLNKDLLEKVRKTGVVKRLMVPHTDSLKKWLEEKSELDGIGFTQGASGKLIENVNFDLSLLKKEYEKLYTYVLDKKDKLIDEKAVEKLVSRVYEMKIFDLVDFIGSREKNRAVRALKSIVLEKQSIIGLVTLLFRMFKFMLYLKSEPAGVRLETRDNIQYTNPKHHEHAKNYMASHLGHAPYMLGRVSSNYTRFSRKYSAGEIIMIVSLLNSYDILLRKGEVSEYNLVLKMINEIVEMKVT